MVMRTLEICQPYIIPGRTAWLHLLPQSFASVLGCQRFFQRRDASVVRPVGHHYQQASAAEHIRIAVEGYILPALGGVFHEVYQSLSAARAWRALVEVRDMNGNAAANANLQRLAERVEVAVAQPIAHMRMVEAAHVGDEFAQLDNLVGGGVAAGRVVQPG